MWLERLKFFTQTSIWRFTIAFTIIVLLICSGILAVVYQLTLGAQKQQLEQSVRVAAMSFVDLASASTMSADEFQQIVTDRGRRSNSLILMLNANQVSIGNLDRFSGGVSGYPQVQRFPIAVADFQGEPTLKVVVSTRVDTRFGELTVGLFDENQQLENTFATASLATLIGASIITLLAGLLFNRRVLQRVKDIGELTSKVKKGQLQIRLPVSRRKDEYDIIAVQINEMLDDIDELVHSVASVTDNIAHDLRTPLSRIRMGIDRHRCDPTELDGEVWREQLLLELDQLVDTFEAMLELSRLEKGVQLIEKKECNLEKICLDVVDLVEPLAEEKNQLISINIINNAKVLGDENLLFRAIYNVFQNAIKYAPHSGQINLRLDGCELLIADNGPGIPVEEFDRVFQRLYRLDKSRSSEGFGMGLAIVKAIIEWHDGSISLGENQPGLCVKIRLPE
ncbi:HAMP domain-containing sensor histidine kinase [Oceanicoccus sp. KOV_DT_Chl]|uniref:sensor histidine kinase n=1 Tax=Oceanicoccus sp. KOV_DT_Chl TaxID=1904639 RepID=UPI000C7A8040|nr:HAMP domain-containing sensor histidine kinase [Oceanicoccus sp. KOV_DT_Chl]